VVSTSVDKINIDKKIEENSKLLESLSTLEETIVTRGKKADLLAKIGYLYTEKDNLKDAQIFFEKSLNEYKILKEPEKLASIHGALGSLYLQTGDYLLAKEYFELSYNFWKSKTFLNEKIVCLQNLGIVDIRLGDLINGSEHIFDALKMSAQLQDENQFAYTIQILLNYYEERQNYDMLLELKLKALEFWEKLELKDKQFKTLIDLGVISQLLENYSNSLVHFKKAFNIGYTAGDTEKMYLAQGFVGESYFKLKKIDEAKKAYFSTLKIGLYLNQIKDFSKNLEQMRAVLLILGVQQAEIEHFEEISIQEIEKEKN
jgi:adenylate cyclase